jgi:hypothetical protein
MFFGYRAVYVEDCIKYTEDHFDKYQQKYGFTDFKNPCWFKCSQGHLNLKWLQDCVR